MNRREFLMSLGSTAVSIGLMGRALGQEKDKRPNILFCIADDWGWPDASIVGMPVIKTPTFDRVAREGVMFENAFVSAPSCTPSRGAILTGQWHWRLEEGANLWSTLPAKFDVYPDMLESSGYHVGYTRKGWAPGFIEPGGRKRNPAGRSYRNFDAFMKNRDKTKPFCFWFGSHDPHRAYKWKSGVESGMKIEDVRVPGPLPDSETVRTDVCDYYWEVQRFDREVGELIKVLQDAGELDHTMVVMTGDNGMPFPRCKSNLYDRGTNVPLAVRWPQRIPGGRVVDDFVSLSDLAPTFLEVAGLEPTEMMTAKSFLNVLLSDKSGQVDPERTRVFTGMERHTGSRPGRAGYPMRAIRTHEYLYIHNFKSDRWPASNPEVYRDIDNSPTKTYMMEHRNGPAVKRLFELAFGKRPTEELYDLKKDPNQLENVAGRPEYAEVRDKLRTELMTKLKASGDPRALGNGDVFDAYPYYGDGNNPNKKKQ